MKNEELIELPLTKEKILDIIQTVASFRWYYTRGQMKEFMSREIDIMISKGYGEEKNVTGFFCVKGSPNKLSGIIKHEDYVDLRSGKTLRRLVCICDGYRVKIMPKDKMLASNLNI